MGSWKVGRPETSERSQRVFLPRGLEKNSCIGEDTEVGGGVQSNGQLASLRDRLPKVAWLLPSFVPSRPGTLIVSFSSRFVCHRLGFRESIQGA